MKLIFGLHAQSPFEASSLLSETLGIYGYFINNKSVLLLATGPPNATTHNLHEADETYHRFQRSSRLFQTMLLGFSVKVLWFWLGTILSYRKELKVAWSQKVFHSFAFSNKCDKSLSSTFQSNVKNGGYWFGTILGNEQSSQNTS